ncbi:predicted protein [Naegleria gruberi]|uniref:Predicted protein n=1 Tax=Naegleria gruberi TaxID=5762 RepID=D2VA14_NAEGR|nr:uncharacterized protein NAEGRDRAFT_32406 [Naegleria gruberi]EFC46228.1 predicted protein [Naegleria gruberi]|eukprot:XP_002678972.1 predicted protein [Naegleria gruberi strain NEG-M]
MNNKSSTETQQRVVPGQRIGQTDTYQSGRGTYVKDNRIHASVVGSVKISNHADIDESTPSSSNNSSSTSEVASLPYIHVIQENNQETIVPNILSVVTAKVIKTTKSFAKVDILCVDGKPVTKSGSAISGLLRVQDIRATEIDKVVLYECLRPGDIILAEVISLGDSRSYYISTARNELGVIYATSSFGYPMIPLDWTTMVCTKTNARELRKVAKVL